MAFRYVRDRAVVVAQGLQRKSERVQGFDVRRIDPKRFVECLPRGLPVVLDGEQLAKVVVKLGGVRLVADALLELDAGRVESADDHEIPAEYLVSLGVLDVQLE